MNPFALLPEFRLPWIFFWLTLPSTAGVVLLGLIRKFDLTVFLCFLTGYVVLMYFVYILLILPERNRWVRRFGYLIVMTGFVFQTLIQVLNYYAQRMWAENISLSLIVEYLGAPMSLWNLINGPQLDFPIWESAGFSFLVVVAAFFSGRYLKGQFAAMEQMPRQVWYATLILGLLFPTFFGWVKLTYFVNARSQGWLEQYHNVPYYFLLFLGFFGLVRLFVWWFSVRQVGSGNRQKFPGWLERLGVPILFFLPGFYWSVQIAHSERTAFLAHNPYYCLIYEPTRFGIRPTTERLRIQRSDQTFFKNWQPPPAPDSLPNVLVIVVDALRSQNMSVYGYPRATTPFLDSLYRNNQLQRVDLAVSTCANSYCGILSIMGSRNFKELGPSNFKIHDYLRSIGYRVNFLISGAHESWYGLREAYGWNIDAYYDYHSANRPINDDRSLLDNVNNLPLKGEKPEYFYVHLMSAHLAGDKFEFGDAAVFEPFPSETPNGSFINEYDHAIHQADQILKALFRKLSEKGYLDSALVIITSDHGEEMGEHQGHQGHGWSLYQEAIRIPMLIYGSGGLPVDGQATHLDVAPSIVDFLGLPAPSPWLGTSIFQQRTERFTFHETTLPPIERAVIHWRPDQILKYLEADGEIQVFDILNDPKESIDLKERISVTEMEQLVARFTAHWGE